MDQPRDYRDPADVDEALSLIRISAIDQAQRLFQICMDNAYMQGRKDGVKEALRAVTFQIEEEIRRHHQRPEEPEGE